MKKLSLLSLLFSSCTLLFFGLDAGDRCDEANFPSSCIEDREHPDGLFRVCHGGVLFEIPCGDNGCNEDATSCNDVCGDRAVTGLEECEPEVSPPGRCAERSCQRIPACGDGLTDFPERCDDHNLINGDGCNFQCQPEPRPEVEPNDDFILFNREPLLTDDVIIVGEPYLSTDLADDIDFFPLKNNSAQEVQVRIDLYEVDRGYRVGCRGSSNELQLFVLDLNGQPLQSMPQRNGDLCSGGDLRLSAGQQVYLKSITDFHYLLDIDFNGQIVCGDGDIDLGEDCEPPGTLDCSASCQNISVPGNGILSSGEQCDDGNLIDGDGCDHDGLFEEESLDEVEPNDTTPQGPFTQDVALQGSISPVGDLDLFRYQNNSNGLVLLTAETFNPQPGAACETTTDTLLSAFDQDGLQLASNDDIKNPGNFCSRVQVLAPAGEFIDLRVAQAVGGTIDSYGLSIHISSSACGDGLVQAGEACDDGNLSPGDGCDPSCQKEVSCGDGLQDATNGEQCDDHNNSDGDGCSADCQFELVLDEGEPNNAQPRDILQDALVIGSHAAEDTDIFRLRNDTDQPRSVEITTAESASQIGLPCLEVFTLFDIVVFDQANQPRNPLDLVTRGLANCERLQLTLGPNQEARFFLSAIGSSIVFDYVLAIDYQDCGNGDLEFGEECETPGSNGCDAQCQRVQVCGDGVLDRPELCDDFNTISGDGCDSECQLEGSFSSIESEPNDDGFPTQEELSLSGSASFAFIDFSAGQAEPPFSLASEHASLGSINPAGDDDFYEVHNSTNEPLSLRIDTYHPILGVGNSCGLTIDTQLDVMSTIGLLLANNNDRAALVAQAPDLCSGLTFQIAPAQSIILRVSTPLESRAARVMGYVLVVVPGASLCGNAVLDPGEQCEPPGTAACDESCHRIARCGDGIVDAGESCDDNNTTDGDGCDSICQLESAGCQPGETLLLFSASDLPKSIPDNDAAGAVSVINVNDGRSILHSFVQLGDLRHTFDGDLKITLVSPAGPSILLFDKLGASGDDLLNTTFDDGCLGAGGPISGGTAPFSNCFAPGNSLSALNGLSAAGAWALKVVDTAAQDVGVLNSWSLGFCVSGQVVCGDGNAQAPEECDDGNLLDGDGCNASCVAEVCGDGILHAALGEDCDDANTSNNDGCDNDCIHRADLTETEPNDDGSISLGGLSIDGNDFSSANANGPFVGDTTLFAALSPAGDEDVFEVQNPTAAAIDVRIDVFAESLGLGVACGATIDTGLNIRDAAGALLAQSDDRAGAQDRCSGLSFTLTPGQTIFAHVVDFRDDSLIPGYFLVIDFQ